ncbi:hypothetical protein YC2023_038499 [Brassica napus]
MTIMKPTASLDTWRDHFRRGDSDIFEFKSRRDAITEPLFSCQVSRCIRCDQPELSKAGDKEANNNRKTVETVGVDSGGHEEDETKGMTGFPATTRKRSFCETATTRIRKLPQPQTPATANSRNRGLLKPVENQTPLITIDELQESELDFNQEHNGYDPVHHFDRSAGNCLRCGCTWRSLTVGYNPTNPYKKGESRK